MGVGGALGIFRYGVWSASKFWAGWFQVAFVRMRRVARVLQRSPDMQLVGSEDISFFLSFIVRTFRKRTTVVRRHLRVLLRGQLSRRRGALIRSSSRVAELMRSGRRGTGQLVGS